MHRLAYFVYVYAFEISWAAAFCPCAGVLFECGKTILSQLKAIDNTHALRVPGHSVHQLIRGRDLCYHGKTLEVDLFFSPALCLTEV